MKFKVAIITLGLIVASAPGLQAQFTTVQYHDTLSGKVVHAAAGDTNGDGVPDIVLGDKDAAGTGRVRVFSGVDGSVLQSATMPAIILNYFGEAVSGAGDVNGDGFDDFMTGDSETVFFPTQGQGEAWVYSGFDGSIIHHLTFPGAFGCAMTAMGDVNGDGMDDFAVSSCTQFGGVGRIRMFSGADGSVMWSRAGQVQYFTGSSLANAQDVNNDGVPDLLAFSAPRGPLPLSGIVDVLSGVDGSVLYSFTLSSATSNVDPYRAADGVGDINGDGFADILIADVHWVDPANPGAGPLGRAQIISGMDGSVMNVVTGTPALQVGSAFRGWGYAAGLGDVDGDMTGDFALAMYLPPNGTAFAIPQIHVFSGATGQLLSTLPSPQGSDLYTQSVSPAGDLNGDGLQDLMVASRSISFLSPPTSSELRVYVSGTAPVSYYASTLGSAPAMQLAWQPLHGHINNPEGELVCTGANGGASGVILASLARADIPVAGIDLLVAVDNTNFLLAAGLGASSLGEFHVAGLTRRNPFLAGSAVHIQFIETAPTLRASNGLTLTVIP